MVNGMESFRNRFKDYTDCYTVIGGAACDILMTEASMSYRATKDIDMILVIEDRFHEFASVFWEYIREGGYRCGWKTNKDVHFYRFTDPKPGFPIQIELFSRKPDYHLDVKNGIIPLHIDDDVSSLSAILLNEDFYQFMMEGRKVVDGICVLDAVHIIPFKMYAWLDLERRKSNAEHVNSKDLLKHKYDVFRLAEIIPTDISVRVSGLVKLSVDQFLQRICLEDLPLSQIGVHITQDQAVELLKRIYR